jgi:hypothetical protein
MRSIHPGLIYILAGFAMILLAIAVGRDAMTFSVMTGIGVMVAAISAWIVRLPTPLVFHAGAILALLMQPLGLCAQACGGFGAYEYLGPIKTSWMAYVLHAGAILMWVTAWKRPAWFIAAACVTGFACGGSLFYAITMFRLGSLCPSCVGAHAMTLLAVLSVIRVFPRENIGHPALTAALMIPLSGFGINAMYHQSLVPTIIDPSAALIAEMRLLNPPSASGGSSHVALVTEKPLSGVRPMQSMPEKPMPEKPVVSPQPSVRNSLRKGWDALTIGSSDAPVQLWVALRPTCPHCALQERNIRELGDLVSSGAISIRYLPIVDANAEVDHTGSIILAAAGMIGPEALTKTLEGIYAGDHTADSIQEMVERIPDDIQNEVLTLAERFQDDISVMLTDSRAILLRRGLTSTPVTMVVRRGEVEPVSVQRGEVPGSKLRLAIDAAIQSQRIRSIGSPSGPVSQDPPLTIGR